MTHIGWYAINPGSAHCAPLLARDGAWNQPLPRKAESTGNLLSVAVQATSSAGGTQTGQMMAWLCV